MTALHGDKIESLLWENGFEFQHKQYLYLPSEIEIYADTFTIVLGETWLEEDEWMLDGDSISFELVQGGETFEMGYLDDTPDEDSLILHIVELGER